MLKADLSWNHVFVGPNYWFNLHEEDEDIECRGLSQEERLVNDRGPFLQWCNHVQGQHVVQYNESTKGLSLLYIRLVAGWFTIIDSSLSNMNTASFVWSSRCLFSEKRIFWDSHHLTYGQNELAKWFVASWSNVPNTHWLVSAWCCSTLIELLGSESHWTQGHCNLPWEGLYLLWRIVLQTCGDS